MRIFGDFLVNMIFKDQPQNQPHSHSRKINLRSRDRFFQYRWDFSRSKFIIFERSRGILRWFLKMLVRLFCFKPPFLSIVANFLWSRYFLITSTFSIPLFYQRSKRTRVFRWLLTFIKIRWLFSIDIGAHFLLKIKGFIFLFSWDSLLNFSR